MSNNNTDREVIVSVKHVDISFDIGGKKKFKAVKDANFDIYKGETFALVGESGSGKSVEAYSIMGLLQSPGKIVGGTITFDGEDLLAYDEEQMRNCRKLPEICVYGQVRKRVMFCQ